MTNEGVSLTTVTVAVIALLVLIVLCVIFIGRIPDSNSLESGYNYQEYTNVSIIETTNIETNESKFSCVVENNVCNISCNNISCTVILFN